MVVPNNVTTGFRRIINGWLPTVMHNSIEECALSQQLTYTVSMSRLAELIHYLFCNKRICLVLVSSVIHYL